MGRWGVVPKKFLGKYIGPRDVSRSLGKDNSNAHGDPGRPRSKYLRTYLVYKHLILGESLGRWGIVFKKFLGEIYRSG